VTLVLGETAEGAAVAGYSYGDGMLDVSLGMFNGKVDAADEDDNIDSFVAKISAIPFEGLTLGASYTSNLASSDTLSEEVQVDGLDSMVGGVGVFVTWTVFERLTLVGEYVGAISEFEAGELYDDTDTEKRQPAAWNVELAFAINDAWEVAARYGGSDDGGLMIHESEYGALVGWGLFNNTRLALEYLHGTYQDDVMEDDAITLQLAILF